MIERLKSKRIYVFILTLLIGLISYSCGDPGLLFVSNPDNTLETSSPVKVSTPVGPQVGKVDQTLTYTIGVNTDLGDGCKYGFDWGDGSYTWKSNAIASHSWSSSGIYVIRAQVRCDDVISEWSSGTVVMIGSAAISRSPLNQPDQAKRYITPNDDQVNAILKTILAADSKLPYGDFDAIREWVAANISYKRDKEIHLVNDFWQLPIETLERRTGDCEDISILLCSLLRAYGVNSKDIYVAVGSPKGTDTYHSYLFERYTRGYWRAIEPQIDSITSAISFELIDQVLTYDYSSNLFCFNDRYFFRGIPNLGTKVYEAQVAQSFWPFTRGANVIYERTLETEEKVEGTVEWIGAENIMFNWDISIYDPQGDIILNWSGKDKVHEFSLIAPSTGVYRIEILKRDFIARYMKLSISPTNWKKL